MMFSNKFVTKLIPVLCFSLFSPVLLTGCSAMSEFRAEQNMDNKIGFDLKRLDQDGLYTVDDGKRALSYEFCIPADVDKAQAVLAIDPSAIIYQSSKDRVNCGENEYLVLGDTFQTDYRVTLQHLVNLKYVMKIVQAHFE